MLLAVDHASKVRLLAVVALVKGTRVQSKSLQVSLVGVSCSGESLAQVQSLVVCHLKSHLFEVVAQLREFGQLCIDLWAARVRDLLLAGGASHEGEGDLEGVPPVLEELEHAIGVEGVAAAELDAGLFAELAGVADGAEVISVVLRSVVDGWEGVDEVLRSAVVVSALMIAFWSVIIIFDLLFFFISIDSCGAIIDGWCFDVHFQFITIPFHWLIHF